MLSSQYNSDEFKREFKEKSRRLWESMPIFVSIVVSVKVVLYISSFFTSMLNNMLSVNASKTLFSLHIWRLFTAPLATDGLFDCLLILTFYMVKVVSPMEHLKGTSHTLLTFLLKSAFYVFVLSVFALVFGPRDYFVCGLFPLNVADICQRLFQDPEKEVDMCIMKLSQKHLAAVIVGFCFIFLGEPLASTIAVCALAYFDPLKRLGEAKIDKAVKLFDQKLSKIPGFISLEEAEKNAQMNTDDLIAFDRNQMRGRVSQGTGIFQHQSTRPSSSASTSSTLSGGSALGGDKQKDDSNLLNLSSSQKGGDHQGINADLVDLRFDQA